MPFSESSVGASEQVALRSTHARYARHTANALGYMFASLDGEDGYLFEVREGARRAAFSAAAGSPYAFNRAHAAAIARDKLFAQRVLVQHGVATIPSQLYFANDKRIAMRAPGREPADALAFAARATFPVFCKPVSGAQGAFAEVVHDRDEFARYLQRVGESHYAFVVQPVIEAPEHRVMVLRGRVLFAYQKLRPALIGDGVSNLGALFQRAAAPNRNEGALVDAAETMRARDAGGRIYRREDIAPQGARLNLEGAANRALGGGSAPPIVTPSPHLAEAALASAAALRLDFAAVDLFDTPEGPVVIEVNSNPAIKTLEDHGRWDLIEAIWRANFDAAFA